MPRELVLSYKPPGSTDSLEIALPTDIGPKYKLDCQRFFEELIKAGLVYSFAYHPIKTITINKTVFDLNGDPTPTWEQIFEAAQKEYGLMIPKTLKPPPVNHYVGIQLADTELGEHIYKLLDSVESRSIYWTWPTVLHITLGWFEGHQDLTPVELEKISEAVSRALASIEPFSLKITEIVQTESGNLLVNVESESWHRIQQQVQKELKSIGINFEFAHTPHIQVGSINPKDPISDKVWKILNKNIKRISDEYAAHVEIMDKFSILHYDESKGINIEDKSISFSSSKSKDKPPLISAGSGIMVRLKSPRKAAVKPDKYTRFRTEPKFRKVSDDVANNMEVLQHEEYRKSMLAMEQSATKYATSLVVGKSTPPDLANIFASAGTTEKGLLQRFATLYSQRYLDMLEASIAYDMANGIPMLDLEAGKMKMHGFTTEDIIKMQGCSKVFVSILEKVIGIIGKDDKLLLEDLIQLILDEHKGISRRDFMDGTKPLPTWLGNLTAAQISDIRKQIMQFTKLTEEEQKSIKLANFLMSEFAHMGVHEIIDQFNAVANQKHNPVGPDVAIAERESSSPRNPSMDTRLLMEIRQRISGEGTNIAWGAMGSNPLAYLNVVRNGVNADPSKPASELEQLAEFRGRMYFAYMLNHFANSVVQSPERISFINRWLADNKKGWQIDPKLVAVIQTKGPSYLPPVFRYGPRAAINKTARRMLGHLKQMMYYEKLPDWDLGTLHEKGYQPTAAEKLALTGDISVSPKHKMPKFGTGAGLFEVPKEAKPETPPESAEYIRGLQAFSIPSVAGISGTLDQSTIMAAIVGLGLNNNPALQEKELQTIKLAFMAFMLPNNDHSLHEILDSSTSFGLPYGVGPDFVKYINPYDPKALEFMEKEQRKQGTELPETVFQRLLKREKKEELG